MMSDAMVVVRIVAVTVREVTTNGTPQSALHEMCRRLLNVVGPSDLQSTLEALQSLEQNEDPEVAATIRATRRALEERTRRYTQL